MSTPDGGLRHLEAIRLLAPDDAFGDFSSGSSTVDGWLHLRSRRAMREDTARVYVLYDTSGSLCGFYALSSSSVVRTSDLPGALKRKTPSQIPCTLLGQLGVDIRMQSKLIGARLLQDAIGRSLRASKVVASRALVVDALNQTAFGFYKRFGFQSLDGGFRMFIRL